MRNPFIPRETIHAWSDQIADEALSHQTSLQRLLQDQRRLTRWIEENQSRLNPASIGISVYLTGVIARMFEMAGGRLRNATWELVREAETQVGRAIRALEPSKDGFLDRLHAFGDRAQPHIVDEAAMVLFEIPPEGSEDPVDPKEMLKILAIVWVVTDVLDRCWSPPKSFEGQSGYTFVAITPTARNTPDTAE